VANVYARRIGEAALKTATSKAAKTAPRPRNAAATREAILQSALKAFARAGYDGVGVREIAAGAGVTAMLINRYFGSKEQLFAEVVADTLVRPVILTEENIRAPERGATMARALIELTAPGATPLDGFLIMFHSASSPIANEITRNQIEAHHYKTMVGSLNGDLAPERAALALSVVAGVQVLRQMIGLPALTGADPEALTRLLAPLFQALIDGDGA
jgi:AcrR family transcriptional regulator